MELTYYYDETCCDNGTWILFNILTGKILSVSPALHDLLASKKWSDMTASEIELLTNYGFLIASHDEEVRNVSSRLNAIKDNSENLVVTILTNMNCNLGCRYCHENGLMDYSFLNENNIHKINRWLENQISSNRYKVVTLYFYGGEPTLNMNAIEDIAIHTTALSYEYDFSYNYSMATNATLLSDEVVSRLERVNVYDLQVTLDGPPKIHDYRKPFIDGKGTFDIILNSVLKYHDRLNFTIRANVDKNNYEHIPELLDIIKKYNLHEKAYFYLDLVSSTYNDNEYCSNNVFTSLDEMSSIVYLWKEQVKRGIPLHGKNIIEGLCGNLSKSNITISSSGNFYICPGLCGIEKANLGDLDHGFNSLYNQLISTTIWEDCKSCKYFPMCAGGCRAQAYQKHGNCFSCHCKKDYYEKVVMEYIKYKYVPDI